MSSHGYGYVGAKFGACGIKPTFGTAKLSKRKEGTDQFYEVITPCEEYKITSWESFWDFVKEFVQEQIDLAKNNEDHIPLSETRLAAEILQCVEGKFISKKYYKLAYSPSYAKFVFELNKYILGIFYQNGLITQTDAKKRIAGILKNLNTRAL